MLDAKVRDGEIALTFQVGNLTSGGIPAELSCSEFGNSDFRVNLDHTPQVCNLISTPRNVFIWLDEFLLSVKLVQQHMLKLRHSTVDYTGPTLCYE